MPPHKDWLARGHPDYNPNLVGAISHAKVIAALVASGRRVLQPVVHVAAYDLVIEDQPQFYRVQCKTGHLVRGAVVFRPHRLRAAKRETGWERRVSDYQGLVDFFGVYCPENDRVYLVPIAEVTTPRLCSLRLTRARNNQNKRIRLACTFEVISLLPPPQSSMPLFEST